MLRQRIGQRNESFTSWIHVLYQYGIFWFANEAIQRLNRS
ncbi:hypothetical protein PAMC26577_21715 [Caballeronia sordidicola]|uniref:Uncharacterized protein n=1 Tax=Caballeronia sordidicola TaxID=196367 RepID=A0A242MLV3_CABSO|nr:hypothetical protein PAMC26577_21715 [Caballeronia sordidicola]